MYFFFEEATCPGQLRCLGQNFFSRKSTFLRDHLSRAASLPGAELLAETYVFLNKPLVLSSFAAWGKTFLSKNCVFLNRPLVLGSSVAWGRTFPQNQTFFRTSHLSRAASLPGAELFLKNVFPQTSLAIWGSYLLCSNCLWIPGFRGVSPLA